MVPHQTAIKGTGSSDICAVTGSGGSVSVTEKSLSLASTSEIAQRRRFWIFSDGRDLGSVATQPSSPAV
ncbi:hypothetical protein PAXRUDRAFT_821065, partial [Paxillus rubicundulus Ve08.2h10]